jgi:hypothetical protein
MVAGADPDLDGIALGFTAPRQMAQPLGAGWGVVFGSLGQGWDELDGGQQRWRQRRSSTEYFGSPLGGVRLDRRTWSILEGMGVLCSC